MFCTIITITYFGFTPKVEAVWYSASWTYRQPIVIQSSQVDADLTDFPVYVNLNDLDADFHTNVKSDGGDIRITKSDGTTEVPRELVFYNSSTDTGELHFKADGTLSSSSNTTFYIYYGNSGASDYAIDATYGAENVWSSQYDAVYHMQQDPASTTTLDSTANDFDLTTSGNPTSSTNGKLAGNAQAYDGTGDYLQGSHIPKSTDPLTITAWFLPSDITNPHTVAMSRAATTDGFFRLQWSGNQTGDPVRASKENSSGTNGNAATSVGYSASVYSYGAAVFTTNTSRTAYLNAGSAGTNTTNITNGTMARINIGAFNDRDSALTQESTGTIDEVRFLNVALASTWLSTEYNNQNSPSTFYSVTGGQETDTGGVIKQDVFWFE